MFINTGFLTGNLEVVAKVDKVANEVIHTGGF